MQHDADEDEREDGGRRCEREEGVAQDPGAHAHEQHLLDAEPREEQRHEQHEARFGDLAPRLRRRDLRDAGVAQEDLGEVVVGRERDAEQQRRRDEDVEGAVAELRQRVEADDTAQGDALSRARRWRMRQREAVEAEQHTGPGRGVERQRRLFRDGRHQAAQDEADEQPGDDPADGAEHADERKLFLGVAHVAHGDGVGEGQRGEVSEHVTEEKAG